MKKVSFDFDDTLSFKSTQDYAKKLIGEGIEVHITTSRYADLKDYYPVVWPDGHSDLFKVAKELSIPEEHIHFTNFINKFKFLKDKDFVWHLDDNNLEIEFINHYTKTKGIWSLSGNYEYDCNKLLDITDETN